MGWRTCCAHKFPQQYLGLSDESIEDAIYDSQSTHALVGIDLGRESAPYATTVLKFHPLLDANGLTHQRFNTISAHLAEKRLLMREVTIVDATLIAAPPSTKNKGGKRDPEMHKSKKGNDWHFSMKTLVGVDAASGLVHTVVVTAGNVADVTQAHASAWRRDCRARRRRLPGRGKLPENIGKSVT